jgi:hypothetical protein
VTFSPLLQSAAAYLNLARAGILAGAAEIGAVLRGPYGLTADQAAAAMKTAGYAVTDVAQALQADYGATDQAAAQALAGAGYAAGDAGNALHTVWASASPATIAGDLKDAGYPLTDTGNYIKNTFNLSPDALNSALTSAGYPADQIGNFFQGLGGDFADFGHSVLNTLNPTNWF